MRTDVCLPIPVGSPWAASRPLAAEGVGRQEAFEALDELIALDDLLPLLFQVSQLLRNALVNFGGRGLSALFGPFQAALLSSPRLVTRLTRAMPSCCGVPRG
jgi:hypothetical protein